MHEFISGRKYNIFSFQNFRSALRFKNIENVNKNLTNSNKNGNVLASEIIFFNFIYFPFWNSYSCLSQNRRGGAFTCFLNRILFVFLAINNFGNIFLGLIKLFSFLSSPYFLLSHDWKKISPKRHIFIFFLQIFIRFIWFISFHAIFFSLWRL